jgi:hypothetical protein
MNRIRFFILKNPRPMQDRHEYREKKDTVSAGYLDRREFLGPSLLTTAATLLPESLRGDEPPQPGLSWATPISSISSDWLPMCIGFIGRSHFA